MNWSEVGYMYLYTYLKPYLVYNLFTAVIRLHASCIKYFWLGIEISFKKHFISIKTLNISIQFSMNIMGLPLRLLYLYYTFSGPNRNFFRKNSADAYMYIFSLKWLKWFPKYEMKINIWHIGEIYIPLTLSGLFKANYSDIIRLCTNRYTVNIPLLWIILFKYKYTSNLKLMKTIVVWTIFDNNGGMQF